MPPTARTAGPQQPENRLPWHPGRPGPGDATGRRYVDKLVKVRLNSGEEQWILIHIEVQMADEGEFPAPAGSHLKFQLSTKVES